MEKPKQEYLGFRAKCEITSIFYNNNLNQKIMTTKETILELLKKESNLTAFEIATKTGLVMKSVSNEANTLVKDGLLSKVKHGQKVVFSLIEKAAPELPKTVEEEKIELKNQAGANITGKDEVPLPHEISPKDLKKPKAEKKDRPKEGSLSEKIYEYLLEYPEEKIFAVSKKFGTYYSVVERVVKRYINK